MRISGQNIKWLLIFDSRGPRRSAQVAALRPPEQPSLHLDHRGSTVNFHSLGRHSSRFSTGCRARIPGADPWPSPTRRIYPPMPSFACLQTWRGVRPGATIAGARRSTLGRTDATPCCRLLAAPHRRELLSNSGPPLYGASNLGTLPAVVELSPHRSSLGQIAPLRSTPLLGRRRQVCCPTSGQSLHKGQGAIPFEPYLAAEH